PVLSLTLTLAIGYACGSLPFGLWVGRLARGVDVRTLGSGNLGATNVYRSLGPPAGIATLLLDMAKGALPALWIPRTPLGAAFPGGPQWCAIAVGVAAVLGHAWTFLAGFRGGKGVATAGGVMLALAPLATLAGLVVFVAVVWMTRYISLGSVVSAALFPALVAMVSPRGVHDPVFALSVVLALVIVIRHRSNLGRLRRGEERRFSLSRGGSS
ncbi:MAG TPA: glycerol-3-phosphate 1-O-acyltransferase PlsY, partial [Dongiaceae bacterium]|nr:glycerol-3-phosphate 1-O-acyltransferase PlsY [Dongiaceae bacterium]